MPSRRFGLAVAAVTVAIIAATLPITFRALLRHMFTTPDQTPWTSGRLRLINVLGLPAQALNSDIRAWNLVNGGFRHKVGDVWVVSYVKSGTTWTIGMLAALWGHPSADYAGSLQQVTRKFCPQPELPDLGWGDDGFGHSMDELNDWSIDADAKQPYRCFKSHWPSRDHVSSNGKSRFIYVLRNAQDQITSHWNQVWGMGFHYGTEDMTFEGGWDGFVEDWLNGDVENGQYFDHVASWFTRSKTDPNVLLVRFEDMKEDPDGVIRRIANFIGVEPTTERIQHVRDMTSFDKMKQADENDVGLRIMRFLGVIRRPHIRQGEVGRGKLRFSEEQLKALERGYEEKLKPLGVPRGWILHEDE